MIVAIVIAVAALIIALVAMMWAATNGEEIKSKEIYCPDSHAITDKKYLDILVEDAKRIKVLENAFDACSDDIEEIHAVIDAILKGIGYKMVHQEARWEAIKIEKNK